MATAPVESDPPMLMFAPMSSARASPQRPRGCARCANMGTHTGFGIPVANTEMESLSGGPDVTTVRDPGSAAMRRQQCMMAAALPGLPREGEAPRKELLLMGPSLSPAPGARAGRNGGRRAGSEGTARSAEESTCGAGRIFEKALKVEPAGSYCQAPRKMSCCLVSRTGVSSARSLHAHTGGLPGGSDKEGQVPGQSAFERSVLPHTHPGSPVSPSDTSAEKPRAGGTGWGSFWKAISACPASQGHQRLLFQLALFFPGQRATIPVMLLGSLCLIGAEPLSLGLTQWDCPCPPDSRQLGATSVDPASVRPSYPEGEPGDFVQGCLAKSQTSCPALGCSKTADEALRGAGPGC